MLPSSLHYRNHAGTKYTAVVGHHGGGVGRWRLVLGLMALVMCVVCFVMFFFLPETSPLRQPIISGKALPVVQQQQKLSAAINSVIDPQAFLLPNVPHHHRLALNPERQVGEKSSFDGEGGLAHRSGNGAAEGAAAVGVDGQQQLQLQKPFDDVHVQLDRQRLEQKIRADQLLNHNNDDDDDDDDEGGGSRVRQRDGNEHVLAQVARPQAAAGDESRRRPPARRPVPAGAAESVVVARDVVDERRVAARPAAPVHPIARPAGFNSGGGEDESVRNTHKGPLIDPNNVHSEGAAQRHKAQPQNEGFEGKEQRSGAESAVGVASQPSRRPIVDPRTQGIPKDEETRRRREKVKEMTRHAWRNYERYAWGENELRPITKRGHSAGIFGESRQGATIVDGLDTLLLMGFTEEFERGRRWIDQHLDLRNVDTEVSVFETNIRFIGGLLTLYTFTGDEMFKRKAEEIATALLPAFQTPTGIPFALVVPKTQKAKNYGWSAGGCSILAEFGTMQLEFDYLSEVTGNPVFSDRVSRIRRKIYEIRRDDGLYPNYLDPKTGSWGQVHISLGALGDSFYEYLLKAYIQKDRADAQAKEMFLSAMDAVERSLLKYSEKEHMLYLSEMRYGKNEAKMDHLSCFAGGLFGLASTFFDDRAEKYLKIGKELTSTCHQSYNRSDTGLGPESFRFSPKAGDAKAIRFQEKYYILRPEVIESYFYLWRLTKDQKYRDWGWEAVLALEKHCRTDGGYTGIKDVYNRRSVKDDVQQSFFLAETLKYLYLLFSEDDLLPLDEWVFNTEAHPLPIRNRNPIYQNRRSPKTWP